MKTAYFDCFSGAAGDMIVGAMLDAGLDAFFLRNQIDSLGIDNLEIEISTVKRCGVSATSFKPVAPHQHHHRKLADITEIINRSSISASAKERAIRIFNAIAHAEGAIHGKPAAEIGFHEVGAVDSIVDVVSACVGAEALGIQKVCCSTLSVGGGTVQCAHGTIPVPAPATVELLKVANAPTTGGPIDTELLTPTAAAIIADFTSDFGPLPSMTIQATGYGAGTKDFEKLPNVLRMIIGESTDTGADTDCVCLLECNIDDVSPETIGYVIDRLFDCGALDAYTSPIHMKHNRPGAKLSVIASPEKRAHIERVIFEQGLTLGIRRQMLQRSILKRRIHAVRTEYGDIRIKIGSFQGAVVSVKPEHADCALAAKDYNVSLTKVKEAAMAAFKAE